MESTAIGLVLLNSKSVSQHINARCDARLIYGRGGFHGYLFRWAFKSMSVCN